MQRKKSFLVVWLSILTSSLWAQAGTSAWVNGGGLKMEMPQLKNITLLHPTKVTSGWNDEYASLSRGKTLTISEGIISDMYGSGYYIGNLGFFCKKELEIEKTTHLPLRFRLGSLEYCNRLEGK